MKNKLYYLGTFSGMVTACGCLFKIMHWPAAGILIVIGLVSLSFVFLPLAIWNMVKAVQVKKLRNFYILVAIVMAFNFIGAMFKIMHWPGAGLMMIIGIPVPIVVFLPVYLYYHYKEKEESLTNFMYIMFFLVYLSVMSSMLSITIARDVLENAVSINTIMDNSPYYELKRGLFIQNGGNKEKAEQIQDKTNELLSYIDKLKKELILVASEKNQPAIIQGNTINMWDLEGLDEYDKINDILIGYENNGKAKALKQKIDKYKSILLSNLEDEPVSATFINDILNTEKPKAAINDFYTWEGQNLYKFPLVFIINYLSDIQNNIRQAELETWLALNKKSSI